MTYTFALKTPEGERVFLAVYEAVMKSWTVPNEEIEIPTRFGMTWQGIDTSIQKENLQ